MVEISNPAHSPRLDRMWVVLWICAALLAIGGAIWAFVLAPFVIGAVVERDNTFDSDQVRFLIQVGLGYLVWAGYFVRCAVNLSQAWRRVIWAASTVVQGYWLLWFMHGLKPTDRDHGGIFICWWIAALTISIFGFFAEPHADYVE